VGADPPHRASRTRARLEEPPKPSRPLSVAVARKAPVSAVPLSAPSAGPRAPRLGRRMRSIHLRGQSRATHPGFRETHPATRTPFHRIGSRPLAALGLPESPSPHPSGCDPDEACAGGLDQPASPFLERRGEGPRTVFARDPPGGLIRLPRFVRARSRVPAVRFSAHISTGRRDRRCVRSTSALRNRSTRALVLRRLPAQRPRRVALFPEPCGSVLDHANVVFACGSARPETRGAGTFGLGAFRCKRDRGEPRFTARLPLRRPVDRFRGRCLPSASNRSRSPLTPLSPPSCS